MINKKDFLSNVEDILNVGIIENKPLSNIDILKFKGSTFLFILVF